MTRQIDQAAWRAALLGEMAAWAASTRNRNIQSIFFGGGTPSLMAPATAAALIESADKHWGLSDAVEITLEANPTSVETERLRAFRDAGVNRVSLGVQALKDADLAALGRGHSADEARQAIAIAADLFDRHSFDLIYARPHQTAADWERELREALTLAGDHLSIYQLTIEPGTAFHRDRVPAADAELGADLYDLTQALSANAGLPAYEISNHARPGSECRHNLVYWQGGDYLGLGPGAHGRLGVESGTETLFNWRDPGRWLTTQQDCGRGLAKRQALTAPERAEELILMGLRLTDGINRARFARHAGRDLLECLDKAGLDRMIGGGFITLGDQALRATAEGRMRLNALIEQIVPG